MTNPVATWSLPVNTTQDAATYKANIDACAAVAQQIVDNFAPRPSSPAAMTVTLDPGSLFAGVALTTVGGQTSSTITAPSSGNNRIDRIVIDASAGNVSVVTGTPTMGTATPPAIPSGALPIAQVSLTSSTTSITGANITDERNFWGRPTSGVTAGSYTYSSITVDASGRVTSASNGASIPLATSSVAGIVKPDGTVITIGSGGAITVATATSSALGVVQPDGTVITVSSGVITVAHATAAAFGVVKVDNSSITASSGVISAPGAAKAWVTFAGSTGTIAASFNVTSVTRTGTGDYVVNFTNNFADTAYAVVADGTNNASFQTWYTNKAVGSVEVKCENNAFSQIDPSDVSVVVFR